MPHDLPPATIEDNMDGNNALGGRQCLLCRDDIPWPIHLVLAIK
jgi:hypothetical protein